MRNRFIATAIWLTTALALPACSDVRRPTQPLVADTIGKAFDIGGWACTSTVYPGGETEQWCQWSGPVTITYNNPPISTNYNPFTATTTDYPYCGENPTACGSEVGGGGPSGPGDVADNTGWENVAVAYFNPDDQGNAFVADCRFIKCPTPDQILHSPAVLQISALLRKKTSETGVEWAVLIYMNPDGTLRAGPLIRGEAHSVTIPSGDIFAVAAVHTHPGGGQLSPADKQAALDAGIYVVATTANGKFYIDPQGPFTPFILTIGAPGSQCFILPCP